MDMKARYGRGREGVVVEGRRGEGKKRERSALELEGGR